MLTPTGAADTIRRAQTLLRTEHIRPPAEVADAIADMLDVALAYARIPGPTQQYPATVKGVRLAEVVLAEWGGE